MNSRRTPLLLLLLVLLVAAAKPALAPQWPRDEDGSVLFTGVRKLEGADARRPAVQKRLQTWTKQHLQQISLVQQGALSYRGEFYGSGQLPPVTVDNTQYRLHLSIGAQLEPENEACSYRLEYLQCQFQRSGKLVSIPIEEFLNSTDPAHKQAADAMLEQVQKFIAAL